VGGYRTIAIAACPSAACSYSTFETGIPLALMDAT
jgi:hypothetical protein